MHKQTLLVTGGCGYIGSHVTRQLSEAGYSVVVLDNLSTGFSDALLHNETLVRADINDEKALDTLFSHHRFAGVLHFAASIVVPESVAQPLQYYQNNSVGTLNLLKACVKHGVERFVFSSTAAVFGDTTQEMVSESTPTAPTNPYSRSKLVDEWILDDVSRAHPLRYVVLRYFNVAGADPEGRMGQRSPNATHLIKVACEAIVGKREGVTVYGTDYATPDGTGIRDYIHVEDLADAHVSALKHLEKGGESGTFNCGYGHGYSVLEVLEEIQRVAHQKIQVTQSARRPGDVPRLVADPSKLRRVLGWKPKYDSLNAICASALTWERKLAIASRLHPAP